MARIAIHPGEHLAEELDALKMSAAELARRLNVPTNRVTGILNGSAVLLMYAALSAAPVSLVAPVVATYPLVTVLVSAAVLRDEAPKLRSITGAAITVAIKSRVAILDVGGVADLAHLAVADDVDADRDLALDRRGDRIRDSAVECRRVVRLALFLGDEQRRHVRRTRQAAHMRRQQPIGTEFQPAPPIFKTRRRYASASGESQAAAPTSRPISRPSASISMVVGRPRALNVRVARLPEIGRAHV